MISHERFFVIKHFAYRFTYFIVLPFKNNITMKTNQATLRKIKTILEELRQEIRQGTISYGEIVELHSLKKYIEEGDVELLEWAGVNEFEND